MAEKDKQPQQADFDKAWENIKKGKTTPGEPDMGPLPTKKVELKKKEDKVLPDQLMNNPVRFKKPSQRTAEENAMMSNYKKGGSVKSSASKRADGIATKGKTKGRII